MGLSIEERAMKEKIENYSLNEKELDRLHQKLIVSLNDTGKLTANYGFNAGGGKYGFTSKVENVIVNKITLQEKIMVLEDEIYKVNISQTNALNKIESEVIDYVKNGFKMSHIARIKKMDRKDIKNIRNRAIKKMAEYIDNNT